MKSLRLRLLVSNGRCHHALQHSRLHRARLRVGCSSATGPSAYNGYGVCAAVAVAHTVVAGGHGHVGCTAVRGDSLICHPADCLVTGGQPVPVASVAKRRYEIGWGGRGVDFPRAVVWGAGED